MKNLFLILCLIFSSTSLLVAQDDCMQFFPSEEGTVLVNKSYDAKSNLLSTMTYRIDKTYNYQSGTDIKIATTMTDKNNNVVETGTLDARCDDGKFYLSMVNKTLSPEFMNFLGEDTELVGDFLDYPNSFSNPPYSGDFEMKGGKFTVKSKTDKKESMIVSVYGRQYEKNEKITTPAGTFDAAKVTFNFEVTKGKKTTLYRGTEWYALNAGIVRAETADKKGKLLNYTELTSLTKGK